MQAEIDELNTLIAANDPLVVDAFIARRDALQSILDMQATESERAAYVADFSSATNIDSLTSADMKTQIESHLRHLPPADRAAAMADIDARLALCPCEPARAAIIDQL